MTTPSSSSTCGSCGVGARCCPTSTCTVPRGQVVGLLGPSGGGKSTLMRAVVGVQVVAGGTVTVLGEAAGSPGLRHRVGYLTQAPSVYGDLSVRDNVGYLARVIGVGADAVDRAIAAVDLVDHAARQGREPLRRPAVAGQPGVHARGRPRGARARRADRRARPGAAARPVGPVPAAGGGGAHGVRLQPRHGRGRRGATGCSCCATGTSSATRRCPSCSSAPARPTPSRPSSR